MRVPRPLALSSGLVCAGLAAQRPELVADINTLPDPNSIYVEHTLARLGSTVLFRAPGPFGEELYRASASTPPQLVRDILPGSAGSQPESFTVVGNRLFFTADGEAGRELWVSDGTTAGTQLVPPRGTQLESPPRWRALGAHRR
jgi:ELWxxDGT repeat protein